MIYAFGTLFAIPLIAEAKQEGAGISERERTLLNRLRESLGITESDAAKIENELLKRLPRYG